MYPNAVPVPRIHRALALIQAVMAALTLVGLVIWWMASYSSMGSDYENDLGLGGMMFILLAPTLIQVALLFVPLIGLAVFVARGSLPARVASCCIWGVLMLLGLVAVQVHPAYVLVLFVALCMLLALSFADRLGGGRPLPPPIPGPGPGRFAPPLPYPTGQFPAVPPHPTGQFPVDPPHPSGQFSAIPPQGEKRP
ncbi:hypothetical protein [Tsukamurella ocularis]|uniref:hypothetical protein n=1 Tax=Tsukamurella ocularis TaxID=1970234 RepID=UPI0021680022|nr:hypothetical protein [Tsukamurella ocularis]MCS3779081.1 hypothetical protein [Tsukamurella ocularis]MCS3787299.1 hypothetical protein [Tsukamurella ocularis]MCS3851764.1 hypothetical protein [Tsukamurella ocularis]